jgi:hypothetical protein
MNNINYKIIPTLIIGTILLLGFIYIIIFGRALGQSENHGRIVLILPKVIFTSKAVQIDDKTYLAKNISSFVKAMEEEGFIHVEQLGAGHIFRKNGNTFISISRMYSSYFVVFTYPKKR